MRENAGMIKFTLWPFRFSKVKSQSAWIPLKEGGLGIQTQYRHHWWRKRCLEDVWSSCEEVSKQIPEWRAGNKGRNICICRPLQLRRGQKEGRFPTSLLISLPERWSITSHWPLVHAKENSYATRKTQRKNKNTPRKGLEPYQHLGLRSLVQPKLPGICSNLYFSKHPFSQPDNS